MATKKDSVTSVVCVSVCGESANPGNPGTREIYVDVELVRCYVIQILLSSRGRRVYARASMARVLQLRYHKSIQSGQLTLK